MGRHKEEVGKGGVRLLVAEGRTERDGGWDKIIWRYHGRGCRARGGGSLERRQDR